MNKIIVNAKNAFTLLAITAASVAFTANADAAGSHVSKKHNAGSASTAEVSYIGSQEGQPLFSVSYNNNEGGRFGVSITDAEGDQLFQAYYRDRKFDKKFKISDAAPRGKLLLTIHNFQDNSEQSFEINANTRLVEDVEVKEVK
jgi:hypothetical protein